jgi:hypothetical protein
MEEPLFAVPNFVAVVAVVALPAKLVAVIVWVFGLIVILVSYIASAAFPEVGEAEAVANNL